MESEVNQLIDRLFQYSDKKLSNLSQEERVWLESAVQDIRVVTSTLKVESGIIADLHDWDGVRDRLSFDETTPEFENRVNWERWKAIEPVLVADLEKCESIARVMSERHGVKMMVEIWKGDVFFVVEVPYESVGGLLEKGFVAVDSLFDAWKDYGAWLHGPERLKVVRRSGDHKHFLDNL